MILEKLKSEMTEKSDKSAAESGKRFFKEEIKIIGLKSSDVKKISSRYFKDISKMNKDEIFALSEELLKEMTLEYTSIGFEWALKMKKFFGPGDFVVFEKWLSNYVTNWAACDVFCTGAFGHFLLNHPEFLHKLNRWAKSDNRWMRRASAVVLIPSVKSGKNLDKIFEISDILLKDEDDLVRKGYGWALKVANDYFPDEVFEYVMKNKNEMPRTSLRYAIEKMPADRKKAAMAK